MDKQQKQGFTLIELIVVITILAVLGAVAFISFKGFASDARDTVRVTDIDNLNTALTLAATEQGFVPQPESGITLSMDSNIFATQGDVGGNVSSILKISSELKDPLTGEFYPYITNSSRRGGQVAAFLESGEINYKGENLGLILDENDKPIHKDSAVISAGKFDTLGTTFAEKKIKTLLGGDSLEMKAFMVGGQLVQANSGRSYAPPKDCPENFIPVPGNSDLGQPGFCIGKYEVTVDGSKEGNFLTQPGIKPVTMLDIHNSTFKECSGNGPGYHIMTINERLTVARNIEKVASNWSSGTVGTGHVKGGWNGTARTGISNINIQSYKVTGSDGNSSHDALRQLKLSNGEIIWDFIGNVWEIADPLNYGDGTNGTNKSEDTTIKGFFSRDLISGLTVGTYTHWNNISDSDFSKIYGPQVTNSQTAGMGMVIDASSTNRNFYITGGDSFLGGSTDEQNGLYSLIRFGEVSQKNNIGTRCAYRK